MWKPRHHANCSSGDERTPSLTGSQAKIFHSRRTGNAEKQLLEKEWLERAILVACLLGRPLLTPAAGRTLTFRFWRSYPKLVPHDSNLGGIGNFPTTRWSLIVAARSEQHEERQRALNTLIAGYWKPVYKYIRLRWGKDNEQAKDLTQEFFARLLEKDFLESYDPSRARLRTFLRVCVDRFIANEEKAAHRLKRGGDVQFLSLDFESAEGELQEIEIPSSDTMDDFFAREWVRSVFTLALGRLRLECDERGKQAHFRLLELYDIEEGGKELTYGQVASQFGLKPSDVTNYLAYARREFRRIVLEQLREMTATEDEFRREARALLGIDVR